MAAAPKYNYPLEGFRRRPSELSIDSAGSGSGWRLDPTAVFEAGGKHGVRLLPLSVTCLLTSYTFLGPQQAAYS